MKKIHLPTLKCWPNKQGTPETLRLKILANTIYYILSLIAQVEQGPVAITSLLGLPNHATGPWCTPTQVNLQSHPGMVCTRPPTHDCPSSAILPRQPWNGHSTPTNLVTLLPAKVALAWHSLVPPPDQCLL